MKINCAFKELKDPVTLVAHPRNTNRHSERQIELLRRVIEHHGWRHPIIVSNRSGWIVAGHARLQAAQAMGATEVPVDFQDFESEAAEFQFLVADNKVAELSDHDDAFMIEMIKELDLGDTDFELMGLDDFTLEFGEELNSNELFEEFSDRFQGENTVLKLIYEKQFWDAKKEKVQQLIEAKGLNDISELFLWFIDYA